MYLLAIERADKVLATNTRLRAEAARHRWQTRELFLRYRRHRFPQLSGASDARDDGHVRRRLREFLSRAESPKSYVGPSRGSVCQLCGNTIEVNELEYDVAAGTSELRLDAECHQVFIEESRADVEHDSPDAAGD
jgi:hypothetical protein